MKQIGLLCFKAARSFSAAILGGETTRFLARELQVRVATLAVLLLVSFVAALLCGVYMALPGRDNLVLRNFQDAGSVAKGSGNGGQEGAVTGEAMNSETGGAGGVGAPPGGNGGRLRPPLPQSLPYWSPEGVVSGDGRQREAGLPREEGPSEKQGPAAEAPEVRNITGAEAQVPGGSHARGKGPQAPQGEGGQPAAALQPFYWLVCVRARENKDGSEEIREYFRKTLGYECRLEPDSDVGAPGDPLYSIYLERTFPTKPDGDEVARIVRETAARKVFKKNYFLDAYTVRRAR